MLIYTVKLVLVATPIKQTCIQCIQDRESVPVGTCYGFVPMSIVGNIIMSIG